MKDISILFIRDDEIRNESSKIFLDWTKRNYLKNFIIISKINIETREVFAEEYVDGEIKNLDNVQRRLTVEDLKLIRFVNISQPEDSSVDKYFDFIKQYLNPPTNIELVFLNLLIPMVEWFDKKSFNAATNKANCNILISPVDRPFPQRIAVDIDRRNYSHHLVMSTVAVAALWRGMEKGQFDDEEFDERKDIESSSLKTKDYDVIICRNFARLIVAPDPVTKLLESLSTDDGNWILPNQNFEYSNDDYLVVKNLSDELINKYRNRLSYISPRSEITNSKLSFFEFIRDKYQHLSVNRSLKDLAKIEMISQEFNNLEDLDKVSLENIETIRRIQSKIIKKTAVRGNTHIPELWKDIRSIIFSLIDGSRQDETFSELNKNQILSNLLCITEPEGEDLESLMAGEKQFISKSDSSEAINDELDNKIDGMLQIRSGNTMFENLIEYMFNQMQSAFTDFKTTIENIIQDSTSEQKNKKMVEKYSKQLKWVEYVLISCFITFVAAVTNYLLTVQYEITPILMLVPNLLISPTFWIICGLVILTYWLYLNNSLYNLLGLSTDSLLNEKILEQSVKRFVEIDNISNQTALWSKIYGLLIHSTFNIADEDNNNDDLPLKFDEIDSVSAKLGTVNRDVIVEIRENLVKDGWFYEIYEELEPYFNEFIKDKTLRKEEVMLMIDSEDSTEFDTSSTRYKFYKFLKDGNAKKLIEEKIEAQFKKSTDAESEDFFSGSEGQPIDKDKFVSDLKKRDTIQDKEFDIRLLTLSGKTIEVIPTSDEYNLGDVSISAGMPIQRAIVRTDYSERISVELFAKTDDESIDVDNSCIRCGNEKIACKCQDDGQFG